LGKIHRDNEGRVIEVAGTVQDVTERKQAEEALRRSEEDHRLLFDQTPDGIFVADAQCRYLDVNPAGVRLLGHSRDEIRGLTIADVIAPEEIERLAPEVARLAAGGVRASEWRFKRKDSSLFDGALVGRQLSDGRLLGILRDVTERKQAEERLRQYEKALEGIEEMIVLIDRSYRYMIANRAFLKYRGLESEQVIGRHIAEVLDAKLFESSIKEKLDECFSGKVVRYEMKYIYPQLGERNLSVSYFPIEEQGAVNCAACVLQDVTEAKRAEEKLREYERVVEGLEEMILVVDREYRYILANRAFLNFRGMSAEQVVGHSADEVVGQDVFLSQVKGMMDECFLGKVVQYEMTYNFPNLGSRDLHVSYFPIEGSTGVERIACVLQDITERKMSEEALRKSEERFSKAFRNNPLAVTISTEVEGRYLDVNDAFLNLLGYRRQDVIGRTSTELRFWKEPLDRTEMLRQLKENGKLTKHHTQYRTADGELREAEISIESLELDGQRCMLSITRDVTEIQQLEAQFRQAQKMEAVGRLAGGVAHDFNNILGIIMGYSDISLGLIEPETSVTKYLNEIKKAAQRAALLTQQLLAFSRKQVVFPKILDLNNVVHNAISMFMRLVGEDIEIEFRPAESIGSIKADPGQIEQVLMNLVVNARDAMPHGGKILIETGRAELDEHYVSQHPGARPGQQVVLLVSDTGCGMDEDVKSRIFEPFFTTKGAGQGTGLGLSTVYGIVKQSDGYILVYSELSKGTTFKIYFPIVRGQSEELVLPHEEADPPLGSETILVVEDDTTLRRLAAKLLQDGGYHVLEAKDADDALGIMADRESEIDLLLTDVVLPGSNGAELAKQAKASRPQLRSLFMSGYTGDLVGRQGVPMEQSHFLEKPFTKRSLLTKVYSVLHAGPESSSPPER
jgi:PAS domain S-box-containing protein